jgi:hypothetical protein
MKAVEDSETTHSHSLRVAAGDPNETRRLSAPFQRLALLSPRFEGVKIR